MAHILIVYSTIFGSSKIMAESVLTGAQSVPNTQSVLKTAEEASRDDVNQADALILGCAVHMGSADWRLKRFIEDVIGISWLADEMIGKVGAAFAVGGGFGGGGAGNESTLLNILSALAESGCIIVPLPKVTPSAAHGSHYLGPYARTGGPLMEPGQPGEEALRVAEQHGANVARIAQVIKDGGGAQLFASGTQAPAKEALEHVLELMTPT